MTANTFTSAEVRRQAFAAYQVGLCVVPPKEDGSKAPLGGWKQYQTQRPNESVLSNWYSDSRTGMGLVCGAVSGNLEVLEFDDPPAYQGYRELAIASGVGELVERIEAGYSEQSPSGGIHWFYRCSEIAGNTKLARRPKRPEEMSDPNDKVKTLIETRGEGGFIITAPSYGGVHPTGRSYLRLRGGFDTIATITPEERASLCELARSFDQMLKDTVREPPPQKASILGARPGDDFNVREDWANVLGPYGWQWAFERDGVTFWRRPGKDVGISATTNYQGSDLLYVFSTSTPFESERGYSKFAAFTLLEHAGDYAAAAKALAGRGYGGPHSSLQEEVAPQPLRFLTASEIAKQTPEQVQWIAIPWLVQGGITELDGKIKWAGKTTFVLAMAEAVVTGGTFLDEPTMRSPVIYLTEQPPTSFREALRRANLLGREDFIALQFYDTIGTPWNEVVEATYEEMKRRGAKVLIVDTLPQFAGLKGDTENSSGNALEAIQPLQAIAAQGMGVLIVRHDRKAGGDVGDSARGSSAFGGAVDIILSLRRADGNSPPTVRVIQGIGRFDGTPDKLVIDYKNGKYVSLGTETQVVHAQSKDAILDAMREEEDKALSTDEILGIADVKGTLGKSIIKELFDGQLIRRNGKGVANHPYLYLRPLVGRSEPPVVETDRRDEEGEAGPGKPEKVGWSLYRDEVATDQLSEPGGSASSQKSRSDGTITLCSDQLTLVVSDHP